MDPDQTALRSSLIWIHTVCKNDFKNHKQTTKQTTIVVIDALRDKFELETDCNLWHIIDASVYSLRSGFLIFQSKAHMSCATCFNILACIPVYVIKISFEVVISGKSENAVVLVGFRKCVCL